MIFNLIVSDQPEMGREMCYFSDNWKHQMSGQGNQAFFVWDAVDIKRILKLSYFQKQDCV